MYIVAQRLLSFHSAAHARADSRRKGAKKPGMDSSACCKHALHSRVSIELGIEAKSESEFDEQQQQQQSPQHLHMDMRTWA
ncbi:unnamed protein product [Sphagnum tenellum]